MADDILGLIGRQKNVIGETARLKTEFERTRTWTRSGRITLDTTREEQDRLRARVAELAISSEASPIFALTLKRAAEEMQAAVKALAGANDDAKLLDAALKHEAEAKRQLVQLVNSLRPDNRDTTQAPSGPGAGDQSEGQNVAGPSNVAQLKLLKSLQDELKTRTAEIDGKRVAGKPLTTKQQQEIEDLASRQEKLADLVRNFMREVGIPSEADPAVPPAPKPAGKDEKAKQPPGEKPSSDDPADAVQLLRRTHRNMRAAGKSLGRHDTGTATRKTQRQISEDLDKLIRSAARQSVDGSSQSAKSLQRGQPKDGAANQANSKNPSGSGKGPAKPPAKTKKDPRDSDSKIRQPGAAAHKAAVARQQRLIQEVWGHLPESVKQQLRNVSAENYLPNYKTNISRYFESLAE
jgi:hypothetical protein